MWRTPLSFVTLFFLQAATRCSAFLSSSATQPLVSHATPIAASHSQALRHAAISSWSAARWHRGGNLLAMAAGGSSSSSSSSSSSRDRITITLSTSAPSVYVLRQTLYSGSSTAATWSVTKTWLDIDEWQTQANKKLGFVLPPLPSQELSAGNILLLEAYLNQVVQNDALWRGSSDATSLLAFFQLPTSVTEDMSTPTYSVDVFDVDGTQIRGEEKTAKDVKTGALLAGATAGFFLGGPFGAALGALAANSASSRDDSLGDLTRTAGKGFNVAVKQVRRFNDRYDLTERGKEIFRKGVNTVKNVVDKMEE